MSDYIRVIPRDLFNEAKLLKCMGLLCLKILDNMVPCKMESILDEEYTGFNVNLSDEGSLSINNLHIFIEGRKYHFQTTYNSKSNYPLNVYHKYCEYRVFTEEGEWHEEFLEFIKTIE